MPTTVTRSYHMECAHHLPHVREGHRCRRSHGHNYVIDVTISGDVSRSGTNQGFIIDFWDLDSIMQPIISEIDHRNLNDIPGLENPTAELIAAWLYENILESMHKYQGIRLSKVTVFETRDCWATYEG